ncbi:MAG: peptide deformylase, partial [Dehalococcoidia bacterium]|nr:peptide deformylase [Dehalococcoidia bacterium]
PVLRRKAKRISALDGKIQKLIDDMLETMPAASGVGLAAPQVGVSLRLVVIGMPGEEPLVLINPEVVKKSGEREVDEGCLSVPGYRGKVKRSEAVTVKARDRNWKERRYKGTELFGQVLEHEIDHLDGVLYIDHLASPDDLYSIEPEEDKGL